ncbi:ATP-dependent (S)-NAD(P)H-hydrate dehydratase-like [Macrosteles quadrilineatus]|uniref:ATP-dependent (S)-NAD(P)H-hydrate dehydratase-like n=1 Tax=Macrosteles quadrilineatus TaxID=74068 RepID=UPI0023E34812|nr:ATP-dependent (S)-NAD(P)H-hydrate dehydratase-like [Macrosteles quadrilineatus]XP_054286664.1 ATP-dependent (S)-NAD(P)H-hydrate dehydratase-like [Macrosteles quadrilineatus]
MIKPSTTSIFLITHRLMSAMASNIVNSEVIKHCKPLIPELSYSKHKGESGRIGVFGGSKDFTGAPYYAGMSALRTGADLVFVFCVHAAAQPIKSYSPELMVVPFLDVDMPKEEENSWLKKLHAGIIGPGLGRDPDVMTRIKTLIPSLKSANIPLVFDADGLFFLSENPTVLKDYSNDIYLTPNAHEFSLLCDAVLKGEDITVADYEVTGKLLSKAIGPRVTVVIKGERDIIVRGDSILNYENTKGSPRRCGGQGDVLSGCLGTFAYWATKADQKEGMDAPQLYAALAATTIVKVCNRIAFEDKGRGMLTTDILQKLPLVFDNLFDDKWKYLIDQNKLLLNKK